MNMKSDGLFRDLVKLGRDSTVSFDADKWTDGIKIHAEKNGNKVTFGCVTTNSPSCDFGGNVYYMLYDVNMNIIYGDEFPSTSEGHTVNLPEEPVRVSISGPGSAEIMFRTF